jgi:hypothetical protein
VKKMKHRSIHIFVVLAAVLAAGPRATQELSALKDAAGRRVKAEIFNAFLNLQSDAARPAAQGSDQLLAAADPCGAESRPAAAKRQATQVEVHARREVPADVAMLGEPVAPEVAEAVEVAALTELAPEPPAVDTLRPAPAYVFELLNEEVAPAAALVMLGQPEDDVTRPRPAAARREAAAARRATARRKAADELRREAAALAVRFDSDEVRLKGLSEADILTHTEALRQIGVELNLGATLPQTKVLKVKRAPKPAPAPAPPAPQACLIRPAAQVACGPEGPEVFFAGE